MHDRLHDVEHASLRILADAPTFDDAAPPILESVCTALDWQIGALWIVEPSSEKLRCAYLWRDTDDTLEGFEQLCREKLYPRGVGLPGRTWDTGQAVWIRDITKDPTLPRAAEGGEVGLHGAIAFPVIVDDETFGVFEFFSRKINEPDAELLEVISRIGAQFAKLVEREQLERRLQFHNALLESQGEAAIDGIVILSTDNRFLHWNRRFLEIWGVPEDLVRRNDPNAVVEWKAKQTADPARFVSMLQTLTDDPLATRRDELDLADGRVIDRWAAPVRGPDGEVYGRVLFYRDITAQKRAEQSLRDTERWSSFLAEVSTVMSQTLDYRANLNRLARMTVPMLADWCAIHVLDETGALVPVALANADPSKLAFGSSVDELFPIDQAADSGLAAAVRTGSSLLFDEIDDDLLTAAARDPEHLDQLKRPGFRSAMIVPLVCRDRVLGTLTLLTADSGRRYTKEDLKLAEDLASRAAFPIDNARLYEERARVAQTLQKSLLPPELPDIPGVELAARYHAVAASADVGGDFYDVFPAGQRSWGLALGDVSGKGVEAATVTSLARHTLRTATMATQRPSEILSMLNAALLEQTEPDAFCTAVYALIEPRFGHVNLTASCGGHPTPYVVRSDGTLEALACEGTLLGVVADPELQDVSVDLDFGDKLILYTDGIFDVGPRDARWSQEELEELFAACSKRGVNAAADLIERTVLERQGGAARDDLAFVICGLRTSIFRRVRSPSLWRRGSRDDASE